VIGGSTEHGRYTGYPAVTCREDVRPIRSADDLACDSILESYEEPDEFLVHLAKLRRTDLG
jgi:hypothetical protein